MSVRIVAAADQQAILEVAEQLRHGAVVIAPTDTNYGVFCNPFHRGAAERMYAMKGRDADKPLSLFVPTPVDWQRWAKPPCHPGFQSLLNDVWPGPLNVVLARRRVVPDWVTSGKDTVAVVHNRCQVLNLLSIYSGLPLAATSANLSGSIQHDLVNLSLAVQHLGEFVDVAVEGEEPSEFTISSTIVDLTASPPQILRLGDVTAEHIRRHLPDLASAPDVRAGNAG